jgi:hypothetical protein
MPVLVLLSISTVTKWTADLKISSLPSARRLARCICRTMSKAYVLRLDDNDIGQLLDGLEVRAAAWAKTADYHRTGESPPDFIVEECSDADEANRIATHYRSIIAKIRKQQEEQL